MGQKTNKLEQQNNERRPAMIKQRIEKLIIRNFGTANRLIIPTKHLKKFSDIPKLSLLKKKQEYTI